MKAATLQPFQDYGWTVASVVMLSSACTSFPSQQLVAPGVTCSQAPSPFPISYPGQHAQGTRSRQRQSELRVLVAHIYRHVAGALKPGVLNSSAIIRDRIMGFINDTFAHVSTVNLGGSLPPASRHSCLSFLAPLVLSCNACWHVGKARALISIRTIHMWRQLVLLFITGELHIKADVQS